MKKIGNSIIDVNLVFRKISPLKEDMRVADLGCGNFGHFLFPLAEVLGKKSRVYAVDIFKGSLEEIKRKARLENYHQIETIWSDLEVPGATNIESGTLDAAFLINVLFQSSKRKEILSEAIRLLKSGAKLVVLEWDQNFSEFGPTLDRRVSKDLLRKALIKLNLDLVEEFIAGPYHYGIVAVKK